MGEDLAKMCVPCVPSVCYVVQYTVCRWTKRRSTKALRATSFTHSDVTCAYVAERRQSSAARLAGARAARGVHVRASRRRATGAGAPFCLRRFPTLPRAEAVVRVTSGFRAARGATWRLDTRLGSSGGATWHAGAPGDSTSYYEKVNVRGAIHLTPI